MEHQQFFWQYIAIYKIVVIEPIHVITRYYCATRDCKLYDNTQQHTVKKTLWQRSIKINNIGVDLNPDTKVNVSVWVWVGEWVVCVKCSWIPAGSRINFWLGAGIIVAKGEQIKPRTCRLPTGVRQTANIYSRILRSCELTGDFC